MCAPSLIGFELPGQSGRCGLLQITATRGRFEHKLIISAVWIGTWSELALAVVSPLADQTPSLRPCFHLRSRTRQQQVELLRDRGSEWLLTL